MAINVGRIVLLFFVSSWMIIHLGTKPVRGGSPPRDIRIDNIITVIKGALFQVCARDEVVVVAVVIRSINMVDVIMM